MVWPSEKISREQEKIYSRLISRHLTASTKTAGSAQFSPFKWNISRRAHKSRFPPRVHLGVTGGYYRVHSKIRRFHGRIHSISPDPRRKKATYHIQEKLNPIHYPSAVQLKILLFQIVFYHGNRYGLILIKTDWALRRSGDDNSLTVCKLINRIWDPSNTLSGFDSKRKDCG